METETDNQTDRLIDSQSHISFQGEGGRGGAGGASAQSVHSTMFYLTLNLVEIRTSAIPLY